MEGGADPDATLVERVRGGDRTAFDELVRGKQARLVAVISRYIKNRDDAEEVAQRAFLTAYERIETFRGQSTFSTWLFRIAINLALNHIRGAGRMTTVDLDDVAAFTNSLGTEKLVASEVWTKVKARLAELPPKQRLVVELRLFHELSFREIGEVADCSEDSAKVNFHHGVKRLRELLPSAKAYGR